MENTKPFVIAALVCERVLREPDGAATIVRIVDTFAAQPTPTEPGLKTHVDVTAFFGLKSGAVKGESAATLKVRKPDGTVQEMPQKWPILLNGEDHGANLFLSIRVQYQPGLYWIELYWNGEFMTATSFRLTPEPSSAVPPQKS